MAKIRRYKLTWYASKSQNVAGYKVYWSQGDDVGYDSNYIEIFNFTELPDFNDIIVLDKPMMFGVSAVDFDGNESDITKLSEPFQVKVPKAPNCLSLIRLKKFIVLE